MPPKRTNKKTKRKKKLQKVQTKSLDCPIRCLLVGSIRQGNNTATKEIICMGKHDIGMKYLVEAGCIDVLLDLLQDCGTKTFEDALAVLPTGGGKSNDDAKVVSPTLWTNALNSMALKGCLPEHLKMIISRLKPLMECMCHPRHEFFGSHKEWLFNLPLVVNLLSTLAATCEVVPDMLQQHEEIPSFLIQCLCIRQCRSAIWEELKKTLKEVQLELEFMEGCAALALYQLINCIFPPPSECKLPSEVVDRITQLANTKAAFPSDDMEEEADGEGSKTLATCLMDVVDMAMTEGRKDWTLTFLIRLVWHLSEVDAFPVSDVIPKLITLGTYHKFSREYVELNATIITGSIYTILAGGRNSKQYGTLMSMPSDSRYALAIQAGLLEMCLDSGVLNGNIDQARLILQTAGIVSIEPKSEKAIRKRAPMIRAKVISVHRGGGGHNHHRVAVEMADCVQAILQNIEAANISVPCWVFCFWCKLRMPTKASKRCSQCHTAFYCSQECQKRDWKEGSHKHECKNMMKLDVRAERKGLSPQEVQHARRFQKKMIRVGWRLLSKSVPQVKAQAALLGFQILDCVIELDFLKMPATVTVRLASDFLKENQRAMKKNVEQFNRFRTTIGRNRKNGAMSVAITSVAPDGFSDAQIASVAPDDFSDGQISVFLIGIPHSLSGLSYNTMDEFSLQQSGIDMDELQGNPVSCCII